MNTNLTIHTDTPLVVRKANREYIMSVEADLNLMVDAQVEIEEDHKFTDGLYIRTVFLPKGTFLVGKIHKTSHANLVSKGHCIVFTEFGVEEYRGGDSFISPAWTKRIVRALEDSVWTVFHPTTLTDLKEIEDLVIAKDYAELEKLEALSLIESDNIVEV